MLGDRTGKHGCSGCWFCAAGEHQADSSQGDGGQSKFSPTEETGTHVREITRRAVVVTGWDTIGG